MSSGPTGDESHYPDDPDQFNTIDIPSSSAMPLYCRYNYYGESASRMYFPSPTRCTRDRAGIRVTRRQGEGKLGDVC